MRPGVIILAHGSRREASIRGVLDELVSRVKVLLPQEIEIGWAAFQFNYPNLKEAAESLISQGINRLIVVPYFLFQGRHITEDIPQLVEEIRKTHPEVEFILSDPLGLPECLIEEVARRIEEAIPELIPKGSNPPKSPRAIEQESFELIERLLPPLDLSEEEKLVVKRIVHSTGDPHISSLVRFHPEAISAALSAIREGRPIFTDVKMVFVGINHRLARDFGCDVYCALDTPGVEERARREGTTRGEAAFKSLGEKLSQSIVAVGNSPTSLLALLDLIKRGIRPAFIVGTPVGFVQARESKEELMKQDIPYITVEGNRGGSAVAVATVNALLNLAQKVHG